MSSPKRMISIHSKVRATHLRDSGFEHGTFGSSHHLTSAGNLRPDSIETPGMDSNPRAMGQRVSRSGILMESTQKGVAPRHGFEPRFTAPKAAVLPLDDRGVSGRELF